MTAPAPIRTPVVSVIVRSMDRASLAVALDSIAAQTWPAIEVVIVNAKGATHSPLPAQCGAFEVVPVNGPPDAVSLPRACAANRGLDAARGALAQFLDDDDLLLPNHVARLVAALQAAPQAPAAFADVEMGREHNGSWQPLHVFDAGFDATRLWFENYLPIHAVLFRVDSTTPRFDEAFDLFEDWDFWLQLAASGDFTHVPGVSARYRVTEIEQSNVFAQTPQTDAARTALFRKWQARIDPAQHARLLERLQTLFRESADQRAQAALAATTVANLKAMVTAREEEIAAAARQRTGLERIVVERDRELAESHAHSVNLEQMLAARTDSAQAAATHATSLAEALAHREQDAEAHSANLSAIIGAREHETAQALAHAEGLTAIVSARDAEIAAISADNASLRESLQALQASLQALRAERPLQALKRTLTKSSDEPGPR